jgi:hypothetical protein
MTTAIVGGVVGAIAGGAIAAVPAWLFARTTAIENFFGKASGATWALEKARSSSGSQSDADTSRVRSHRSQTPSVCALSAWLNRRRGGPRSTKRDTWRKPSRPWRTSQGRHASPASVARTFEPVRQQPRRHRVEARDPFRGAPSTGSDPVTRLRVFLHKPDMTAAPSPQSPAVLWKGCALLFHICFCLVTGSDPQKDPAKRAWEPGFGQGRMRWLQVSRPLGGDHVALLLVQLQRLLDDWDRLLVAPGRP